MHCVPVSRDVLYKSVMWSGGGRWGIGNPSRPVKGVNQPISLAISSCEGFTTAMIWPEEGASFGGMDDDMGTKGRHRARCG